MRQHAVFFRTCLHAVLLAAVLLAVACKGSTESGEKLRSAYYWSTTWQTDSTQQAFLSTHDIKKIYLRFFDVVVDPSGNVMPNATVRFATPVAPGMEYVPTVFIVNDCFDKDTGQLDQLLLRRILQICETHDVTGVKEIQIDCDWTQRTQKAYFAMLQRLRDAAHEKGIQLSATIRLHQLSLPVPPVDKGVLMMYNTGDVANIHKNPILDIDDAAPYMRHLKDYRLPLSTAYPVFAWQLLVRHNHFVGIMHGDDDLPVLPGDTILTREASPDTVVMVRKAIDRLRPDANDETILFDISNKNIDRIKQLHYEKIFNH